MLRIIMYVHACVIMYIIIYTSRIAKDMPQVEDEIMITERLNPLSTGRLCSASVEHMHHALKRVVAETSVIHTCERYRKYAFRVSRKGFYSNEA